MQDVIILEGYQETPRPVRLQRMTRSRVPVRMRGEDDGTLGFLKAIKKAVTPPKAIVKAITPPKAVVKALTPPKAVVKALTPPKSVTSAVKGALDVKAGLQSAQKVVSQAASGNIAAALQTAKNATKPQGILADVGQLAIKYVPPVGVTQAAVQVARGEYNQALKTGLSVAEGLKDTVKVAATITPGAQGLAVGIAAAELAAKAAKGEKITPAEMLAAGVKIVPGAAAAAGLSSVANVASQAADYYRTASQAVNAAQKIQSAVSDPKSFLQSEFSRTVSSALPVIGDKQMNLSSLITTAARDVAATGYAASNSLTKPTLKEGSKGAAVKEWQRILKVTADGVFGKGTKTATINFQKARKLTADGIVGQKTWAAGLATVPVVKPTGEVVPPIQPPVEPPPVVVVPEATKPVVPVVPVVPVEPVRPAEPVRPPVVIIPEVIDDEESGGGMVIPEPYNPPPRIVGPTVLPSPKGPQFDPLEFASKNWPFLAVAGLAAWYFMGNKKGR